MFFPYKSIGKQTWHCHKKVKRQRTTILLAMLVDLLSPMIPAKGSAPRHSQFWRRRFLKFLPYIWVWRPSWSMDRDHFSNFSFLHPKEASYEIWAKLAQRLQRRSRLKMLTDGHTDGQKVITIAHPEQSSGELKTSVTDGHTDGRTTWKQYTPPQTKFAGGGGVV